MLCALNHNFTTLLCVGETGEQKDYGISEEVIRIQLKKGLYGVTEKQTEKLWIAYERYGRLG